MVPGKDIALAYKFATYDAAVAVACKNAADDPDLDYRTLRITGQWVIAVYDNSEHDNIFLGYL